MHTKRMQAEQVDAAEGVRARNEARKRPRATQRDREREGVVR